MTWRHSIIFLALLLTGCSTMTSVWHGTERVFGIVANPSVQQAEAVGAAENIYTTLAFGVTEYVKEKNPGPDERSRLALLDNRAYDAIVVARDAVAKHDSAALSVAICLVQVRNQNLANELASLVNNFNGKALVLEEKCG